QSALLGKTRGEFHDDERGGQKKQHRRNAPQADRRRAIVRGDGDPTRPQDRSDIEEQDVPESHHARQLEFWGGRHSLPRSGQIFASKAGISWSWIRKLRRKGSLEASNSLHGPKKATRPSSRKTRWSASFLPKWVSCVTTTEVLCSVC